VPIGITEPLKSITNLEFNIFYVSAYLAPIFIVPLIFMWIIKPFIEWSRNKRDKSIIINDLIKAKKSSFYIMCCIILSIVFITYLYSSLNKSTHTYTGVDFRDYLKYAELINNNPINTYSVTNDLPFTYILIYCFQLLLSSSTFIAVKYIILILYPILIVSIYYLTLEITSNNKIAIWASFFTICGIQTTVGLYSFFLSNILGLSLIFLSIALLFRATRLNSMTDLALACIFGILVIFTHPWTFIQYYFTVFITTIILIYIRRKETSFNNDLRYLFIYLLATGFFDLYKSIVLDGYSGISATSTIILGLSEIGNFWANTIFSFRYLYGGLLANLTLIILAIIGLYFLNSEELPNLFFTIHMIPTSILFVIGNETIKSRLIFNLPIGLFASIGFLSSLEIIELKSLKKVLEFYVAISMLTYVFRSLANLV